MSDITTRLYVEGYNLIQKEKGLLWGGGSTWTSGVLGKMRSQIQTQDRGEAFQPEPGKGGARRGGLATDG